MATLVYLSVRYAALEFVLRTSTWETSPQIHFAISYELAVEVSTVGPASHMNCAASRALRDYTVFSDVYTYEHANAMVTLNPTFI